MTNVKFVEKYIENNLGHGLFIIYGLCIDIYGPFMTEIIFAVVFRNIFLISIKFFSKINSLGNESSNDFVKSLTTFIARSLYLKTKYSIKEAIGFVCLV